MSAVSHHTIRRTRTVVTAEIISGLLIVLFLYTGLSKLSGYKTFAFVLGNSPLLHPVGAFMAIALPVAEIAIALFLFLPATRLRAFYASLVLLFIFTAYLIYMVTFSPELPCNCGGVLQALSWRQHIFFNLFFIAAAISGIVLEKMRINRRSIPPP